MKKSIAVFLGAVMLVSCGHMGNSDNATQAKRVPVSQIYDGYDTIDHCEHLVLPREMTRQNINEVYSFKTVVEPPKDLEANAKKTFKAFWKDSYDESTISCDDKRKYFDYNNGSDFGNYYDGSISLTRIYGTAVETASNEPWLVGRDDTKTLNDVFPGTELTVGMIAQSMPKDISDIISEHEPGFDILPYSILDTTAGMEHYALLHYGLSYKGVPMQSFMSSLFDQYIEDGENRLRSYAFSYIEARFDKDAGLVSVSTSSPLRIVSSEKQEKIISLVSAVKLLDSELAENIYYEIDDVQLMYCCKTVQPELSVETMGAEKVKEISDKLNKTPQIYEPTWCFIGNYKNGWQYAWSIKVNALTGEVTIDAPRGVEKQK